MKSHLKFTVLFLIFAIDSNFAKVLIFQPWVLKDDSCSTTPCLDGEVCSLNKENKPVCACSPGFIGKKCAERFCPITEFKGENFKGEIFVDKSLMRSFDSLDRLAKKCQVTVNVTQSFTRSIKPDDEVPYNQTSLYTGRAVLFYLKSGETNVKNESPEYVCFNDGLSQLELEVSGLNLIQQKSNKKIFIDKDLDLKIKQNGCQFKTKMAKIVKRASKIPGKWKVEKSVNFDEYLKESGVNWFLRNMITAIKPTLTINNEGNVWNITVDSPVKKMEWSYELGVEQSSATPFNKIPTKTIIVSDGPNKLIENSIIFRKPVSKIKRVIEIVDDKLIQTITLNKVVCTRIFKRIN